MVTPKKPTRDEKGVKDKSDFSMNSNFDTEMNFDDAFSVIDQSVLSNNKQVFNIFYFFQQFGDESQRVSILQISIKKQNFASAKILNNKNH